MERLSDLYFTLFAGAVSLSIPTIAYLSVAG